MSSNLPRTRGSDAHEPLPSLTDRVLARVHDASLAEDQRAAATRPKISRRRRKLDVPSVPVTGTPEQIRERRSLRRVFLDLGDSYRDYRRRTGVPVAEDVREAADRFRRDRDVPSLVAVAAVLDGLDILTW